MQPEERAEAAYHRWIAQVSDQVRQLVDGTPYRQAFIDVVAEAVSAAQEAVALGTGSPDLPRPPQS